MNSVVILSNYRSGTHSLVGILEKNGYNSIDEIFPSVHPTIKDEVKIKLSKQLIDLKENFGIDKHDFEMSPKDQRKVHGRLMEIGSFPEYINEFNASLSKVWLEKTCGILHRYHSKRIFGTIECEKEASEIRKLFGDSIYVNLHRDPIDCAVSFYFARHYKQWFDRSPKMNTDPPKYDSEELLEILEKYKTNWYWENELLEILGAHIMSYEDLFNDTAKTLDLLSNHIGSKITFTKENRFKKQEDPLKEEFSNRLREQIKNGRKN